jgi:hypothetical protein
MKKAALLFLLGIYNIASFGIGVNAYYCCGKLTSISISLADHSDAKNSKATGGSCCNTKHQFAKVHDSHFASAAVFQFNHSFVLALPVYSKIPFFTNNKDHRVRFAHGPPFLFSSPLYILHCDYRI